MSGGTPRAARWGAVALAVSLVAAAVIVHQTTPDDSAQQVPYVTAVQLGETGTGRNLRVRVDQLRTAELLGDGEWQGESAGVWVVADITTATRVDSAFVTGVLELGGLRYTASDRPGSATLQSTPLQPGLVWRGSLAFEVPAEVLAEHGATARFRFTNRVDARLDSSLELDADLSALDLLAAIELRSPERAVA